MVDWSGVLDSTKKGPRPTLANVVRVLQRDPTLDADHLYLDTFSNRIIVANSPSRPLTDEAIFALTVYIQQTVGIAEVSDGIVAKAIQLVASQRPRHAPRDWVNTLTWDQVPRLETAFEDYWGVVDFETHPQDHVQAVSRNFFLGIAARIDRPGCKLDTMPVFEGAQGILKSSALELLASPPWYAVSREAIGTKDFLMVHQGKIITEIAELDSFNKADITSIKNTMSTAVDTYRVPYGRVARDYPRQGVFAGTTNRHDWANDATGARRFYPVRCGEVRLDLLAAARDQLFAEAMHRVRAGEPWWLVPTSTLAVQQDRYVKDVWTDTIAEWVGGRLNVTIKEVLMQALSFDERMLTRRESSRVADVLRHLKWTDGSIRRNGHVVAGWKAPNVADERFS